MEHPACIQGKLHITTSTLGEKITMEEIHNGLYKNATLNGKPVAGRTRKDFLTAATFGQTANLHPAKPCAEKWLYTVICMGYDNLFRKKI
jgi:hypothetical protein